MNARSITVKVIIESTRNMLWICSKDEVIEFV